VVLRYFDDLSETATAALMGCSRSTVNNHVTRGLSTLRGLLATDADDALAPASAPTDRRRQ
jgi:DNA-directed RNA polymerase specialized sigma24 family protein